VIFMNKRRGMEQLQVRDVSLSVQCQLGGPVMFGDIQRFRAALVSAILSFLPMLILVISAVVIVQPALAQNGASQSAPPPQTNSGSYWTRERMREAKPAMPTVPGTPRGASAISGPSGPPGGASGEGPQVKPNPDNK
jgi:hypothetical protein